MTTCLEWPVASPYIETFGIDHAQWFAEEGDGPLFYCPVERITVSRRDYTLDYMARECLNCNGHHFIDIPATAVSDGCAYEVIITHDAICKMASLNNSPYPENDVRGIGHLQACFDAISNPPKDDPIAIVSVIDRSNIIRIVRIFDHIGYDDGFDTSYSEDEA